MEQMLGQFQSDLGNISGEIQSLQDQVSHLGASHSIHVPSTHGLLSLTTVTHNEHQVKKSKDGVGESE